MKPLFLFLILSITVFTSCNHPASTTENRSGDTTSQVFNLDTNTLKAGQEYYQCPMPEDANVISNKPGVCPKCGMDLVKKP